MRHFGEIPRDQDGPMAWSRGMTGSICAVSAAAVRGDGGAAEALKHLEGLAAGGSEFQRENWRMQVLGEEERTPHPSHRQRRVGHPQKQRRQKNSSSRGCRRAGLLALPKENPVPELKLSGYGVNQAS